MVEKSNSGKAILYVATSLDGYIAAENDDLSFLNKFEGKGEDYGYAEFMKAIDVSIMGRRTFDWVQKNTNGYIEKEKLTYIITHHSLPVEIIDNPHVIPYSGDVTVLTIDLLSKNKNLFIVGGGEIIHQLMQKELIDEFKIAIIPILLGGGTLLFKPGYPEITLNLINIKKYDGGLVMLHYEREQNGVSLVDARENN